MLYKSEIYKNRLLSQNFVPWQVVKLDLDLILKLYVEGNLGTALIPNFTVRFVPRGLS